MLLQTFRTENLFEIKRERISDPNGRVIQGSQNNIYGSLNNYFAEKDDTENE